MATGEVGHTSASGGADGTAAAVRLGRDRSVITRDFRWQLALEGKLFIVGQGIEETPLVTRASLDEQIPDIYLQAPPGGNVLIMPLSAEIFITGEGGAAPDFHINVVTANISPTTAGTVITPKSLGKVGATSAAVIQQAPTLAAYTSLQNALLFSSRNALDNLISVEHATGANTDKDDYANSLTRFNWVPSWPLVLADGQSWCFYGSVGTTGASYVIALVYAELDNAAYR